MQAALRVRPLHQVLDRSEAVRVIQVFYNRGPCARNNECSIILNLSSERNYLNSLYFDKAIGMLPNEQDQDVI